MILEVETSLPGDQVIERAVQFFAERVPLRAAFPEARSDHHVVFRGQGGEEIALAVRPSERGTLVRGSTLLLDQPLDRFLSTLPLPSAS